MITDKVLQHYKGYELLIRQLDEALNRYQKSNVTIALGFLGPDSQAVAASFLSDSVPYRLIGGYDEAVVRRLVIGDEIDDAEYIACLKATYNSKFRQLTHRDILGAVYNSGFDISKFGDMWIDENTIYLYVVRELAVSVTEQISRVNTFNIQFEECEFASQEYVFDTLKINVSSLRLDRIIACLMHKSREKGKQHIVSGNVNVNYKTIEDCAYLCNNDDILSVRNYGRFRIDGYTVNKRSGNYSVTLKKYR